MIDKFYFKKKNNQPNLYVLCFNLNKQKKKQKLI